MVNSSASCFYSLLSFFYFGLLNQLKMKKFSLLLSLLILPFLGLNAQTITELVSQTGNVSKLNKALEESGLDEALNADGAFTLFAPNNAAIDALAENLPEALYSDPEGVLADVLLHHVVPGTILSSDLEDGQEVTNLFGETLTISLQSGVMVSGQLNGASVIFADNAASNGVIHVIDAVLIPQTTSIVDLVANSPVHTTLLAALQATGLDEVWLIRSRPKLFLHQRMLHLLHFLKAC